MEFINDVCLCKSRRGCTHRRDAIPKNELRINYSSHCKIFAVCLNILVDLSCLSVSGKCLYLIKYN